MAPRSSLPQRRTARAVSLPLRALPLALLAAGAGLTAEAIVRGEATLSLFLVIPVVSGSSPLFLLGILVLLLGLFSLPLVLASRSEEEGPPAPRSPLGARDGSRPSGGSGGVLLLGPFPLFFGGWKHPARAVYWLAVLVGVALLLVAVLFALAVAG
ncbi:MAG TPA: DUF131 domain-containing protein [Thermoplasmata archaeon]|nr:DUF131 domain-containing protein [Thermoplasmata archaeon]